MIDWIRSAAAIFIAIAFSTAVVLPGQAAIDPTVQEDDDTSDDADADDGTTTQQDGESEGGSGGSSDDGDAEDGDDDKKKKDKTMEEMVEDFEVIEGLFTLYRDKKKGTLYMAVREDQLEKDYIYFSHAVDGTVFGGAFRGQYRGEGIWRLKKYYDRIQLVQENPYYYFDPDSALSRAKDANISKAVIYSTKIKATSEDESTYLLPVDKLFLTETLDRIKQPRLPNTPPFVFGLGKLSKDKTTIAQIRNYPENTDIVVDYAFDNQNILSWPSTSITNPRFVTITLQHSLIAMPDDGFEPRISDQRVGYFEQRVTDLTKTGDVTPYRDLINRWRLIKQDPDAAISDPVEPITFWIENTTPVEFRETIRDATLRWNEAFEAAGFSNAVRVEIQPDDAEWDAGDIRYNVLRWTSSPNPVFGGYGPSFYNPRTGEILGADIMLEWPSVRNDHLFVELFQDGHTHHLGLERDQTVEAAIEKIATAAATGDVSAAIAELAHNTPVEPKGPAPMIQHPLHASPELALRYHRHCSFTDHMRHQAAFGLHMLDMMDVDELAEEKFVREYIYFLTLHEVGHTLGLNHNMKSSQLHPLADIHDMEKTGGVLHGSVMDYPAINIAPEGTEQGLYWTTRVGPYDKWAIEFGYKPLPSDPDAHEAARNEILARSTDPALAFGNDADDMRAAGWWGIDPRVMVSDLTSDAIGYAAQRIGLVNNTIPQIRERLVDEGETWHQTRSAFNIMIGQYIGSAATISRYIGGVQVERFVAGQQGSEDLQPFTPVDAETQARALEQLRTHIFAPDAFDFPPELLNYLQLERRGFDFFGITEDPKLHEIVLFIQDSPLAHVMSPVVLGRMTNSRLYGNEVTVKAFLSDLSKAIFEDDAQGNVNTYRQNLQIRYVTRLLAIIFLPFYDDVSQSAALAALGEIRQMIAPKFFGFGGPALDAETKAHRKHVQLLLRAVGIF